MRQITKGILGEVQFQFNPSEMMYDGGTVWTNIVSAGLSDPIPVASYGKEKTLSFELWINKRAFRDVNIKFQLQKLEEYRESKKPIYFAYGSMAVRVIIRELKFNIQAWDNKLDVYEVKVPIVLQVVKPKEVEGI